MKIRWKKLLTNSFMWLSAEIFLNCIGLDTVADYSEFVFDRNSRQPQPVLSLILPC